MPDPEYAELHCISNFTFLRGASHPHELVEQADRQGYRGLALTDECTLAGVVRAHTAARESAIAFMVGSEIRCEDGLSVVVLAPDRRAYAALCSLISCARRRADKGSYACERRDLPRFLEASGCLLLWLANESRSRGDGIWLKERFGESVWIAVELLADGGDRDLLRFCERTSRSLGMRSVAAGNVCMHAPERRFLQDTLTAIRLNRPLDRLGFDAHPNAERAMRTLARLDALYPPELLKETLAILERNEFSLDELRYEYPTEVVPAGKTPTGHLRNLVEHGARRRWPEGPPAKVRALIEHELALIAELSYEHFFLTVHDIVEFARSRNILCQGRGSAANSAVCYCLGITEVNPNQIEVLMERFISRERNEPPDIDVDFEHERREEVIQHIYARYTRERAALAATVITYRSRSAIRDVGKALGLNAAQIGTLAGSMQWWDSPDEAAKRIGEAGLDPRSARVGQLLTLVRALIGFPRHLSQHVGGFVISAGPLAELVPIENAAMADRTVIQWDKDDLEELGLLKVDVLGLGMLSAIRRSFDLIESFHGRRCGMSDVPDDDKAVYDMICRADTVGVFQIESRAQMAMLPRMRPRSYYDLVIEVAIVRPGPIQGDMVHPYLRRRNGEESVTYPSEEVRAVLQRTLGVPIFQEQVMQLAVVAAGFTPGEADRLRRAMAAWRRRGGLGSLEERLIGGMLGNGYTQEFAEQIFNQIKGFGEYGFPESHSASFALLVYVSAWLKCHEPAAFFCALLNSQPMGFYKPAQLVRAARTQNVEVRHIDVNHSDWDSTLEPAVDGRPAIRLGLRVAKGLSKDAALQLVTTRPDAGFRDVAQLARLTRMNGRNLECLAAAGVLGSLSRNRHRASWDVAGVEEPLPLLEGTEQEEALPLLRRPTEGEDIVADYAAAGLTLGRHPLALLRDALSRAGVSAAGNVGAAANGRRIRAGGIVITRQRPSSAAGVTFVTLEDETGFVNLVVWEQVAVRDRRALLGARLLVVDGYVQKEGEVIHVVARRLYDYSQMLGGLTTKSRDFC